MNAELREYLYVFSIISMSLVFCYYIYDMYKRQRNGEEDYEKYSNIVINDRLSDDLVSEEA